MSQVMRYLGWIIAGAIAAVALGVFLAKAMPNLGKISGTDKNLASLTASITSDKSSKPPPTQDDIAAFDRLRGDLERRREDTKRFYRDAAESLCQWFDGMNVIQGMDPTTSDFKTFFDRERGALQARLRDAGVELGYPAGRGSGAGSEDLRGFNWEILTEQTVGELDLRPELKRRIQERFWIRQRVAELVTQPDLEVKRLLEVRFHQRMEVLDPQLSTAPETDRRAEVGPRKQDQFARAQIPKIEPPLGFLPQLRPAGYGAAQFSTTVEFQLPANQGQTLTFSVAVVLPAPKAAEFVRRFIDLGFGGRPLLVHLVAWRLLQYIVPEESVTVYGLPEEIDRKAAEARAALAPPPALLLLTAQAFEYKEPPRPPPATP